MILVNNEAAPHRHQRAGVGRGVGVELKFFKFGGRSDAKEDPSEEKGVTLFLILGVWLTLLLILCLYLFFILQGRAAPAEAPEEPPAEKKKKKATFAEKMKDKPKKGSKN